MLDRAGVRRKLIVVLGVSTYTHNSTFSAICHLFFMGCPTTVSWFVIAVVVDAVYGFANGTLAHVKKKVLKYLPSVANFNAPATVSMPSVIFWI